LRKTIDDLTAEKKDLETEGNLALEHTEELRIRMERTEDALAKIRNESENVTNKLRENLAKISSQDDGQLQGYKDVKDEFIDVGSCSKFYLTYAHCD
jgi:chromosome segregation ATPase